MTEPGNEATPEIEIDPRVELAAIVDDLRAHVLWMRDAGIRLVRKDEPAGTPSYVPPAPGGRARPTFGEPAPAARPPVAVRPAFAEQPRVPPAPAAPAPVAPAVVRPASSAPVAAPATPDARALLERIRAELGDCGHGRRPDGQPHLLFGEGNPNAEIVFIGDAPSEEDEREGRLFAGRGGDLLTKMIGAMGYRREDVYLCTVVKCRAPGSPPKVAPAEIAAGLPTAERQLQAVRPKVIVALGALAAQALLRADGNVASLRGQWQSWRGIDLMPTFGPGYLLRAPGEKGKAWDDLKAVLAKLGRPLPRRS